MRYFLRAVLAMALVAAAAACDDSPSGSPDLSLELVVRGSLTRDSVVHVRAVYDGDILAPIADVTITASPADAIQLLGGDSLRLLRSGALELRATYDRFSGSRTVDVAAPPPLVVEQPTGRVERGSVVRLRVLRGGAAVPAGELAFTFTPADGGQALGGDSVKLLRAGTVTVRASDGRNEGSRDLTVASPPSIVFDRVFNSNRDVWRVDLDGANLVRLTEDAADDSDPTVAAGKVVFVSLRAGLNSDLYSMPLAPGGAVTRLTRTAANETMPALSADGQRLAYIFEGSGISKLWLAAADGTGAARASSLGGDFAIDASPTWAGSTRVAYSSSAEGTPDIFSFTPPAAPVVLAGGSSNDVDPAFSPDGQFVAFASTRGGGNNTSLYLVAVSSGLVTRLTTATAPQGQPTWTPDGRLVFTEFGANGGQLRWIDPATPTLVHIIDTGAGSARNPAGVP